MRMIVGCVVLFTGFLAQSQPAAVRITKQPPPLTDAVAFDDVRLSVEATGTDLHYFWYHNDAPVMGGIEATLTLNNIPLSRAGTYYVIVSNSLGAVRSTDAVLRVVPDTFGPRILSAVLPPADLDRFFIMFDEDLLRINRDDPLASATNVNNYVVTEIGTANRLNVLSATVGSGITSVRLIVSPNFDRSKEYQVCVFNVSDVRVNFIAKNSCVPIGVETLTNVVIYSERWSYNDSDNRPPADWPRLEFIGAPSSWRDGIGMFHHPVGSTTSPDCTGFGTPLQPGATTYYFRKMFTVSPEIIGTPLTASLGRVIDDGAVFYLNGREFLRANMPSGAITHDTPSVMGSDPGCVTNLVEIGHFLARTNVFAVEVHQQSAMNTDAAFDASLVLRYPITPILPNDPTPGTVWLNCSNQSPGELRLYWTNGFGYALQSASDLSGPWQELQPPSTNVVVPKNAGNRFYRLNKRH